MIETFRILIDLKRKKHKNSGFAFYQTAKTHQCANVSL